MARGYFSRDGVSSEIGAIQYFGFSGASIETSGNGTTSVSSDLAAVYDIISSISADLVASYTVQEVGLTSVSSDFSAVYDIYSEISSSLVATYTIQATGGTITTDRWVNNTGTPLTNELAFWTWWPAGRVGSLTGITPVEGSTALVNGVLTVTGLQAGSGRLEGAVRGATAADDAEYVQHLVAS